MKSDRRTASIDAASLQLIFERLREKVMRRSDEDRHVQRRAIDALRSRIKHLDPPVAAIDTWETVRPRVEKFEEYKALPADDMREMAFDKFMSRLHERDHDGDRDRERDRDRSHSKRDRERDRDRASRAGDSHRPSRHRSRSPEIDAYAADRKKAQADRERQFRKSSFPVSPPPPGRRSRDRDVDRYDGRDRDRERDRERERERGGDRYDGRTAPNRTRERERERGFVSRADPREAGASSELDYGDSKPAPVRRRRESDADREGREAKVRSIPWPCRVLLMAIASTQFPGTHVFWVSPRCGKPPC
jgi:pre-mRNA-processing factor 40